MDSATTVGRPAGVGAVRQALLSSALPRAQPPLQHHLPPKLQRSLSLGRHSRGQNVRCPRRAAMHASLVSSTADGPCSLTQRARRACGGRSLAPISLRLALSRSPQGWRAGGSSCLTPANQSTSPPVRGSPRATPAWCHLDAIATLAALGPPRGDASRCYSAVVSLLRLRGGSSVALVTCPTYRHASHAD